MSQLTSNVPPPATLGILTVCGALFVFQNLLGLNLQLFTMSPRLILFHPHEYYRIITANLFHVNLMHIGMNTLSTVAIGGKLERQLGSFRLALTVIWPAMFWTSLLYLFFSYVPYAIFGYDQFVYGHSVGFSCVIFHLAVLECYQGSNSRSLFGFVSVPSALYPWVLLVVLQLIMPNISFLGHLSGIVSGTAQYFGLLDWCVVGETFLMDLETRPFLRKLTAIPGFVTTSQGTGLQYSGEIFRPLQSVGQVFRKASAATCKLVRNVSEPALVCLFGRGARLNHNIRFWERSGSRGSEESLSNDLELNSDLGEGRLDQTTLAEQERESLVSRIV